MFLWLRKHNRVVYEIASLLLHRSPPLPLFHKEHIAQRKWPYCTSIATVRESFLATRESIPGGFPPQGPRPEKNQAPAWGVLFTNVISRRWRKKEKLEKTKGNSIRSPPLPFFPQTFLKVRDLRLKKKRKGKRREEERNFLNKWSEVPSSSNTFLSPRERDELNKCGGARFFVSSFYIRESRAWGKCNKSFSFSRLLRLLPQEKRESVVLLL